MKAPGVILITLGLAGLFGFMGWALWRSGGLTGLTGGSAVLAWTIAGGVAATAILTGALMWLAFFSSRKGYDEPVEFERREPTMDEAEDEAEDETQL